MKQHVVVTLSRGDTEADVGVRAGEARYLQVTVAPAGLLKQLTEVLTVPGAQGLEPGCDTVEFLEHIEGLGSLL